jgi:hypothetical protein
MSPRYLLRVAALAAATAAVTHSSPTKAFECYNNHFCVSGGCWTGSGSQGYACYIIGGSCSYEQGTCPTGS